ncbi:vancomycin high temperature exclusion protein [Geothrix sp. 21YS21S-4]|uniref:SanA/YdcF family protein n=1 Tax=Geothrix sp. 21YS21S-4 TaxID=3068889 RepID=UPI0027B89B47|nr:ElyC/SanA/YdcF family protein [Geothrix sp. 21YS21S-4]
MIPALALFGDLLWTLGRFPAMHHQQIHRADAIPAVNGPVLVLGAGVYGDGEPTSILEGRLRTALSLYRAGKVRWFLVSGDNRHASYNEPQAMRRWLVKQGVPPRRIVSDYAGLRTWDSLKRAQAVFGQSQVVIVTSDFHLPRALYLADHIGLRAWGVPALTDDRPPLSRFRFWMREYVARHLALWDAWFPPNARLGPREPTPDDWEPAR